MSSKKHTPRGTKHAQGSRQKRLTKLRNKIKSGKYRIDNDVLARAIFLSA